MPERKERNKEGGREHEEGNKELLQRRKEGRKEGRKGKDARIEDYGSQ